MFVKLIFFAWLTSFFPYVLLFHFDAFSKSRNINNNSNYFSNNLRTLVYQRL
jgi:hypothetical protein